MDPARRQPDGRARSGEDGPSWARPPGAGAWRSGPQPQRPAAAPDSAPAGPRREAGSWSGWQGWRRPQESGAPQASQNPGSLPPKLEARRPGSRLTEADSEPLVRTYVITRGRSGAGPKRRFDLVTLIVAVVAPASASAGSGGSGVASGPAGPDDRLRPTSTPPPAPAPASVADFYSTPGPSPDPRPALTLIPEHRAILGLCRRPLSVAEIAAHLALPFSAAAVLVADLVDAGLAVERRPARAAAVDAALLREVIDGLQRL